MEYFIILLYISIIITTIIAQFASFFNNYYNYNFLLFINTFQLFSPNPVNIDIYIYYRDLFIDNSSSELLEFKYYKNPSIYNSIWFFGKKEFFIINNCLKTISKMNEKKIKEDKIFKSRYYKKIEYEILKLNKSNNIKSRQIVIVSNKVESNEIITNICLIKTIKML